MNYATRPAKTMVYTGCNLLGDLDARNPLSRACPKCEARPGQRCWSTRRRLYPAPIEKVHYERKTRKPRRTPA